MLSKNYEKNDSEFFSMVDFVLRELLNNAVEHGNGMIEEKWVSLSIVITSEELLIDVHDEGIGNKFQRHIQNQDMADNLRVRNRGLIAIQDFGFILESVEGHVKAKYKICKGIKGEM